MELDKKKGYVYILVNPTFSGFVKIGKTTKNPEIRARELSAGSGVPAPYAVVWDEFVTDCDHVEKLLHDQLAHTRSRNDREFFAIPLKKAISIASNIVSSFLCEIDVPVPDPTNPVIGLAVESPTISRPRSPLVARQGFEELIEIAEDCKVTQAVEPPARGTTKTIQRIEYEILLESPYKYTEIELFREVHHVRRNRPNLKIELYSIRRSPLSQKYGWGIHRNQEGKLSLIPVQSEKYKELQESIRTVKAYRKHKAGI